MSVFRAKFRGCLATASVVLLLVHSTSGVFIVRGMTEVELNSYHTTDACRLGDWLATFLAKIFLEKPGDLATLESRADMVIQARAFITNLRAVTIDTDAAHALVILAMLEAMNEAQAKPVREQLALDGNYKQAAAASTYKCPQLKVFATDALAAIKQIPEGRHLLAILSVTPYNAK